MSDQLLTDIGVKPRVDLPVMALNDLALTHTPATGDAPPRIDVAHRDRPGEPLISLDPADASTFLARLGEVLAAVWVHADGQRPTPVGRHAVLGGGGRGE